jgi:hypothetical protein
VAAHLCKASWELDHEIDRLLAGGRTLLELHARNEGDQTWPKEVSGNPVQLGYRWLDSDGQPIGLEARFSCPVEVHPGDRIELRDLLSAPTEPGLYMLEFDLVHEHVAWLGTSRRVPVEVIGNWSGYVADQLETGIGMLTVVPIDALESLVKMVDSVLCERVPGALVECGVWRGGAGLLMGRRLVDSGDTTRKVWLFDSFEGLPPPSEKDGPRGRAWSSAEEDDALLRYDNFKSEFEELNDNIVKYGLDGRVQAVKGWFDTALAEYKREVGPIALLRVDAD